MPLELAIGHSPNSTCTKDGMYTPRVGLSTTDCEELAVTLDRISRRLSAVKVEVEPCRDQAQTKALETVNFMIRYDQLSQLSKGIKGIGIKLRAILYSVAMLTA